MNYLTEDEWWNDHMNAKEAAERDAMAYAEEMADLFEFDSDEEREAYIEEVFEAQFAAYEKGR